MDGARDMARWGAVGATLVAMVLTSVLVAGGGSGVLATPPPDDGICWITPACRVAD